MWDGPGVGVGEDMDGPGVGVGEDVDGPGVGVGEDMDGPVVGVGEDVDGSGVGVGEDVDGPGVGVGEDRQGSLGMGAELVPVTCLPGEAAAMVVTSLKPTIAASKRGSNALNGCLATASCIVANPSSCISNPSICFTMPCLNNLIPSTVFHHSSSSISSVPANSPNILPASPHSSNS